MFLQFCFVGFVIKAAVLQMFKNDKMKKKIFKLTVNTGQVMFSGEIYYY